MPDACGEIPRPAPKETDPIDRMLGYVKTLHEVEDGLKAEQLAYERSGSLAQSGVCLDARRGIMDVTQRLVTEFKQKAAGFDLAGASSAKDNEKAKPLPY